MFDYNEDTGVLSWKCSPRNGKGKVGNEAGCINGSGYRQVYIRGKLYLVHRLAWFFKYGAFPKTIIDHINRNKLDNRISNLRCASKQLNASNTLNYSHNKSGVKGVYWCTRSKRWRSAIKVNQKQIHLGFFKDFDEAVCSRLAYEQCLGLDDSPAHRYVMNNIAEC